MKKVTDLKTALKGTLFVTSLVCIMGISQLQVNAAGYDGAGDSNEISSISQSEVNDDSTDLANGDLMLGAQKVIDYSQLQVVTNKADKIIDQPDHIMRYTDISAENFIETVNDAKDMLENKTAHNQNQVSKMIEYVENADKMLVLKPEFRPVSHVNDGIACVTSNNEKTAIHKYVKGLAVNGERFASLYNGEDTIKGTPEDMQVPLTQTGFYTFYVTDWDEHDIYVVRYYSKTDAKLSFDLSELVYELNVAQTRCDVTPTDKTGLALGTYYTSKESKAALQHVIDSIINSMEEITSQEEADKQLEVLKTAETDFLNSLQKVTWKYLSVNGSTITLTGMEGCTVTRVEYNVDENGNLAQGIWDNWEGFKSLDRKTKYDNFVWTDVPDGIYTFSIFEKDAEGILTSSFETVTVSSTATEQDVTKKYLENQLADAKALLASYPNEKDVVIGEWCVPCFIYNKLAECIQNTEILLSQKSPEYNDMLTASLELSNAGRKFQSNIRQKAQTVPVTIELKNGLIHVSGDELYHFSMVKGTYKSWSEYKDSDYKCYYVSDGSVSVQADSNGIYTLRIICKDNTCQYVQVHVTDVLTVEQNNDNFQLTYYGNLGVVSTSYALDNGSDVLNYTTYYGLQSKFPVMGNGTYLIKVKYADGTEDVVKTEATGVKCTQPTVEAGKGTLTVHSNGCNFKIAVCVKGHYDSWDKMQEGLIDLDLDQTISTAEFPNGEYTFYFLTSDGQSYIEYDQIN